MEYTKPDRSSWAREQLENELDGALKLYQIAMKQYKNDQEEITRLQSLTQWVEYIDQAPTEDKYYLVEMLPIETEPTRRYFGNRYYRHGVGFLSEKDVIRWIQLPPEGVK